jgi:hypothetical protein
MQGIMYWNLVTLGNPYHITKDAELDITQVSGQPQRYPGMFNWQITAGSPAFACTCTPVVAEMVTPLPVSLLYFTGSLQSSGIVDLSWATADETNNNYFTVQRSTDGIHFTDLQIISGAGTSTSTHTYSATDFPASDLTYYRIKQTDLDGKFSYSQIISISSKETDFSFSLFPNPLLSGSEAHIDITGAGMNEELKLLIYDLPGRVIYAADVTADEAGRVQQTFNASTIPAGSYIIIVSSENNPDYTQKFVVID